MLKDIFQVQANLKQSQKILRQEKQAGWSIDFILQPRTSSDIKSQWGGEKIE